MGTKTKRVIQIDKNKFYTKRINGNIKIINRRKILMRKNKNSNIRNIYAKSESCAGKGQQKLPGIEKQKLYVNK